MSEKLDKAKLARAREMYMEYKSVPEISMETGLNPRSIRYHVDNHWNRERAADQQKFFEYIADNKRVQLVNITDRALAIIENSLRELAAKPLIKVQDARMVADILEKIDKILKLDEGKATSITTSAPPSTVIELKKRLKVDPFIQLEDVNEKNAAPAGDSTVPGSSVSNDSRKQ
jgi:hypothetical protein